MPVPIGVEVRVVEHAEQTYTVAFVDLAHADLDLYGAVGGLGLDRLRADLAADGRELLLATNAGMFGPHTQPVGLFIGHGPPHGLDLGRGGGNFYLKPNGVFWVDVDGAHVARSEAYLPDGYVRLATQSGPLILEHGDVPGRFLPMSTNFALRSGVCAVDSHTVAFAISTSGVRFYDFGTLFRDELHCTDALYLDGTISILSTPGDPLATSARFGGLLAVTRPVDRSGDVDRPGDRSVDDPVPGPSSDR